VLDVGCGDGRLARLVADKRPDISIHGMDVRPRTGAAIPVETFDGRSIPHGDGSFDVVMFIDVRHHTVQPMILLWEVVRIARQVILIKDHLVKGALAYSTLRLMDWVGNARHDVALPYNYWTPAEWHRAFDKLGLAVSSWESNLRLYAFPRGPDLRPIFALYRATANAQTKDEFRRRATASGPVKEGQAQVAEWN
jgi:SAM-dependent methyltransferase